MRRCDTTGSAHVACGLAIAALAPDWRIAVPLAILSHPVLDLAARWHAKDTFRNPDTWQKLLIVAGNAVVTVVVISGLLLGWLTWYQVAVGLLAWLWADVWWGIRAVTPRFDYLNPHRLWWIRGQEHQEHLCALWWELAVMAVCCVVAVTS